MVQNRYATVWPLHETATADSAKNCLPMLLVRLRLMVVHEDPSSFSLDSPERIGCLIFGCIDREVQ